MVEGGVQPDFQRVKGLGLSRIQPVSGVDRPLTEANHYSFIGADAAGAEAVQLFDSWAGVLPEEGFERWVVEPTKRITAVLRERFRRCR
jgi:uroporphyrinogen decarboxylase